MRTDKLKVHQDEKATVIAAMRTIKNSADAEDRSPTDEENKQFRTLDARCDQINADMEFETALQNREAEIDIQPVVETQISVSDAPITLDQGWRSFGEQLAAVVQASRPGVIPDPRLTLAAASGLGESVPSDGGFLVNQDTAAELMRQTIETGILSRMCRSLPISPTSNGLKIKAIEQTSRADGSRWGGVQAYWLAEAAAKTATTPKFRLVEMSLHKLIGLMYATDELLADTVALEALITEAFAEEFGFKIDDSIIRGTGAGMPLGIMNAGALVSVAKETGQAATTIVSQNIEKMYSRMPARSLSRAVWLINTDCWPQIFQLSHAVGTGGVPMFIMPGMLPNAPAGALLGRPIIPIEQCETLGTAGDIFFVDLQEYQLITKGGMEAATSIHVRFVNDETTFRFVLRLDGQPRWNSALTPYKGSNTLSPYIRLAVRS